MPGIEWTDIARYGSRARADLSASVTHWTRRQQGLSAFEVLKKIIRERRIVASTPEGGFIKAKQRAACFSETPGTVMMRLFRQAERDRSTRPFLKWEPFGLAFWKPVLYQKFNGRPVLYLSQAEYHDLVVTAGREASTAWRVVRFDHESSVQVVDFTHEREWRSPGDVAFDGLAGVERPLAVVNLPGERDELLRELPPGDDGPVRGVLCLGDIRALG